MITYTTVTSSEKENCSKGYFRVLFKVLFKITILKVPANFKNRYTMYLTY